MKTCALVQSFVLACTLSATSQLPANSDASPRRPATKSGNEIVVNFDSIEATHAPLIAYDYLAQYGITVTDMTPGTRVVIDNAIDEYGGRSLTPSSLPNVLTQKGSNDPVSFILSFQTTFQSVRFTRVALIAGETGVTFPAWQAVALDSNGTVLGKVGEPLGSGEEYYSDVPAKTFTLTGPGIKAVRFNSQNGFYDSGGHYRYFAGFSAIVLDDLILIPEKRLP